MSDVLNLPKTWAQVTVADLGKVVSGGTPSTKENSYWGGNISWISPSDLTRYSNKYISKGAKSITQEGLKNSSATTMPAGSIHFSSRAPIGYTVISSCEMTTNQGFKSLVQAQGIFNEYIYYYFKSAKQLAESKATGTTFKEISGAAFSKLPVPLPPTNEQHRIVAKIEELFSELDKGIENLKTASAQLKVYRQALLKHAFEGKLTAQWRAENQDKLESAAALQKRIQQERTQRYQQQLADWEASGKQSSKPKAPNPLTPLTAKELAELPELPEGWEWVSIDILLTLKKKPMATGPFGTLLSKSDHRSSGLPVLGIENIGNGAFVRGNKIFVSAEKAEELDPFRIEAGDVVISRSGTVGEICKIPEGLGKAYISTNLIRISLNQKAINEDFFVYLFQGGGSVKQQVKALCKGSSRDFLNQTILSEIAFPLPGVEEQKQIVSVLGEKLSIAEQLDQTLTASLQQAEVLRQSILKKAFSGQLVPQDPHDEPASGLLARIRTERDKAPKPKSKGKKV